MQDSPAKSGYQLSVDQIQRFLPHRFPFLMVDKIVEILPVGDLGNFTFDSSKVGIKVKAHKAVAFNEPWFQGHFPGFAIMPGVMILEAMAQAASFSIYPYMKDDPSRITRNFEVVLVGVDSVRFRRPVVPGDLLILKSEVSRVRGKLWGFNCSAEVNGQKVAEAEILANLVAAERPSGEGTRS